MLWCYDCQVRWPLLITDPVILPSLGVNLIKSHGVWPIVNAASSGTYSKSCHGTDVELWLQREG